MESQTKDNESRPGCSLLGELGIRETATGERHLPQGSLSSQSVKRSEESRVSAANNGVGTASAGGSKEAPTAVETNSDNPTGKMEITERTVTNAPSLSERLLLSSATQKASAEVNALFQKCLEAVYSTARKLEVEVAAATNTKKEIKALVANLSQETKGLIKWGRESGRVKLTATKGSQTEEVRTKVRQTQTGQTTKMSRNAENSTPVNSPTRTRSESDALSGRTPNPEVNGNIQYLKEEVRAQKACMSKMTEQVQKLLDGQIAHQERLEEQQKLHQVEQRKELQQLQQQLKVDLQLQSRPQHQQRPQQKPQQQQSQQQPQQRQQQKQPRKQPKPQPKKQPQPQPRKEPQPPQQQQQQPTWSEVVGRKRKPKATPTPQPAAKAKTKLDLLRRRVPKTSAVTIDRPPEGGSLSAVMKKVAGGIDLVASDIKVVTTRATRAGGILIEVVGEEKAALLAQKVRTLVGDGARVRQPQSLTPVLLLDIPEWAATEDILVGLQKVGVSVGEGATTAISKWKNAGGRGGHVARVNLPFREAVKLAEAKTVTVGWTRCRVKPIEKAQPRCFRCQERGHLAAECKNPAKPRRCHRCGSEDHTVKDCRQPEKVGETAGRSGAAATATEGVPEGGEVAAADVVERQPSGTGVGGPTVLPAATPQTDRAQ